VFSVRAAALESPDEVDYPRFSCGKSSRTKVCMQDRERGFNHGPLIVYLQAVMWVGFVCPVSPNHSFSLGVFTLYHSFPHFCVTFSSSKVGQILEIRRSDIIVSIFCVSFFQLIYAKLSLHRVEYFKHISHNSA